MESPNALLKDLAREREERSNSSLKRQRQATDTCDGGGTSGSQPASSSSLGKGEPRVIVDEAALRWLSNEAESGRVDPSTLSRYAPLLEESQRRDAAARSVARAMRAFSESRSRVRAVTARNVQLAADLDLDDLASAAKRLDFGSVEAEL